MSDIKWQDFLTVLTLKAKDTNVLEQFKYSPTLSMKFMTCYNANKSYLEEWLEKKVKVEEKSTFISEELRLAGNKIYQKGKDLESLNVYNLSVLHAPYHTNQFALGLSNRSAVLMRIGLFSEAIQDIDLALHHGNDDIPRTKLLIRKAILLYRLNLFKESLQIIKSIFPDENQINLQENLELRDTFSNCLKKIGENGTHPCQAEPKDLIPSPKGGENQSFMSASAGVSLKYSEEKGRYVVAAENFCLGDIIFVEKPFGLVVLPDQYHQHCHHCCKKLTAFIPCEQCIRALFCSELCRETAWLQYHQWECKGLEVCHCIGIAHLGLRIALLADSSDKYKQVSDLLTHLQDMKTEDVYQYAITAVLLTLYLEKYTSYFDFKANLKIEEMGICILRHIAQLICNGHAITKLEAKSLEKGCSKTVTEEEVRIATAIYPSVSMMNHSCDQNISNSFVNDYLIVRASRDIKKGEEVFNCYGPHYASMNGEERQSALKSQYFFTCECTRCRTSDSTWQYQFSALLCPHCNGPVMQDQDTCSDCLKPQFLLELVNLALSAQELHHKGVQLLKEANTDRALNMLEESVKVSSKCLYKHNSDLRTYKDALARVYAEVGRFDESIHLIEGCIITIEKQYGNKSIELSRELLKLFDILSLSLKELSKSAQKDSEEFRIKHYKMKKILDQVKKIEGDVNISQSSNIQSMIHAINSLDVM